MGCFRKETPLFFSPAWPAGHTWSGVKVLYRPDRGNYQPDGKGGGNGVRSGICLLWKLGSFGFVLALGASDGPKIGFALALIGFVWVRFRVLPKGLFPRNPLCGLDLR